LRQRRPQERLTNAIPRIARAYGLAEARVRTWVSFIAVSGALQTAVERGDLVSYQLKGGVALELRFPGIVRATRDLDVGLPGTRAHRVERFGAALAAGFDRFAFRVRREPYHMERADTVRVEVAITYEGRPFQTIDVDLGPEDAPTEPIAPTIDVIETLAIPIPRPISCVAMAAQIAQKIHAGTNPTIIADPVQDRARDIVDIVLLDELGQLNVESVRTAAEAIFTQRAEHSWPPNIPQYPDSWLATMGTLASELKLARNGPEVVSLFSRVMARLVGVSLVPGFEYQFINLPLTDSQNATPPDHPNVVRLQELAREGWRIHTLLGNPSYGAYVIAVLERISENTASPS